MMTPTPAQRRIQAQVLAHLIEIRKGASERTAQKLDHLEYLIKHASSEEERHLYYRAVREVYRELRGESVQA